MKLTQLIETKERPYICVHADKGKHETHAVSSYDAAKNAAKHWGMKSTSGIDAHLAEGNDEHTGSGRRMQVTQADKDNNTEAWKRFKAGDPRYEWKDMILSKREGDVSEAVGEFAEPIYDLIDMHFEGDCEPVFDDLVRYLDGQTISDFVKYFRQNHEIEVDDDGERLDSSIKEATHGEAKAIYDLVGSLGAGDIELAQNPIFQDLVRYLDADTINSFVADFRRKMAKDRDFKGSVDSGQYKESFNDEEYNDEERAGMEYTVWVGGTEVNDNWLSYDEAVRLYDKYKAQGYDDVQLDARLKEGSFWGRDDMVAKMKKDYKSAGMRKYRKQDGGSYSGTTTSDPEEWERLEADGYEWDKDYYNDIEELEAKWKAKNEAAKPDFLDLDKDGDKKEPMKKAAKDKKAVKEENDGKTITISDYQPEGEANAHKKFNLRKQIHRGEDGKAIKSPYGGYKVSFHGSAEDVKAYANNHLGESMNEDEEAVAARDEFLKVMDMKPKTPGPGKQIDTIKKIVADKQNMQVAFDDGKMRVDLYTASAVSQVYDAVKPETQVKIDNMLRTKAGMLKMSDFAFSKFNEGIKEGKRVDEIVPALAMAARAVAPAVGQALKGVAKAAVKNPVKTAQVVKTVKSDKPVTQKAAGIAKITGVTEEELEELQAPYTGADAIIDQNGKKHKPGSSKANMIVNMKRKPAKVAVKTPVAVPLQKNKSGVKKPAGVGRGNAVGSKATQIQPGGGSAAGKTAAANTAKIKQAKRGAMVGKVKAVGKKVGGFVKNQALKSLDRSGIGNPLAASKQYADDMVENAIKKSQELDK